MNFNSRKGIAGYPIEKIIKITAGVFSVLVLIVVAFVMKDMLVQQFSYKEEKYKVFNSVEALRFAIDVTAAGKVPEDRIIGSETPKDEECDNDNCCKQDYGYCYEYCTIGGSPDCSTKGSKESHCISQYDLVGSVPIDINVNGVAGTCRWDCESDEEDKNPNNKGGLNFCVKKDDCSVYYSQDACNEHSDKCKYEIDFTTGEGTCVSISPTGSFLSKITGMATSDITECGEKDCGRVWNNNCKPTEKCVSSYLIGKKCIEDAACIEHAQGTEMPQAEELSLYPNGLGGGCKFIEGDNLHAWCDYEGYFGDEDDKEVECGTKTDLAKKDMLQEKNWFCCKDMDTPIGIDSFYVFPSENLGGARLCDVDTGDHLIERISYPNQEAFESSIISNCFPVLETTVPQGSNYICNIIGFELPQEIKGDIKSEAVEWIMNTGDPQYLIYWQKWPQGEEGAWMGVLDWADNTMTIFLSSAAIGIVSGCTYGGLKENIAVKTVTRKMAAKAGKNTIIKTVGRGADTIGKQTIKSVGDVTRIIGLKKAGRIGKNLVIGAGIGTYTLSHGLEYWLDSISFKFEEEKGNTLFLVNPGRKGHEFTLSDEAKDYHIILERSWLGGNDVSFYAASPCKVDWVVEKYPAETKKYSCGSIFDFPVCGVFVDGPKWAEDLTQCKWEFQPYCDSALVPIRTEFETCTGKSTETERLECFYEVIDNHKDEFETCGCFRYYEIMGNVEEICGKEPKDKYFYENPDKGVTYCKELHGKLYPFSDVYLDVIEISDSNHYASYDPNYCYATESDTLKAFKVFDLGSTILLGWNPAGNCLKRSVVSVVGAGVFMKLSQVTSWPRHAGW